MAETIITASDIAKQYYLGTHQSGLLKRDLQRWLTKDNQQNKEEYSFWALKDISFSIKEGEVTAFIGNNGAGKSTLLKILSGVIAPTKGRIEGKGSIASLLEIGTGFHPELTGRDNVYLNGHLLGMRKTAIDKAFDDIVDFAGIEGFIDTPVKRYSSGMYVRLAFAVAAHMNPDILIIDEVLAVGDTAFQQKCVDRIKHIAAENGKSIIMVSHNMTLIEHLCHSAHWLEKGVLVESGKAASIVNKYLSIAHELVTDKQFNDLVTAPGNHHFKLRSIKVSSGDGNSILTTRQPIFVQATIVSQDQLEEGFLARMILLDARWNCIIDAYSTPVRQEGKAYAIDITLPEHLFNPGFYYLYLSAVQPNGQLVVDFERVIEWYIQSSETTPETLSLPTWGLINPQFSFHVKPTIFNG